MNKKKVNMFITIISVALLLAVVIFYPKLPDRIPIHWGRNGTVDGWGSKNMIFVLWAIVPGIDITMRFAEKIDPKGANYKRFDKVFLYFRIGMSLFMSALVVITLIASFDADLIDMNKVMFPMMGIMFMGLGNYMPKVKYNYTFGIKTPHTLASENVWNKTHRMAGPLWVAVGAVMALCGFLKGNIVVYVMLAVVTVMVIVPMVYAYMEYKKEFPEDKGE